MNFQNFPVGCGTAGCYRLRRLRPEVLASCGARPCRGGHGLGTAGCRPATGSCPGSRRHWAYTWSHAATADLSFLKLSAAAVGQIGRGAASVVSTAIVTCSNGGGPCLHAPKDSHRSTMGTDGARPCGHVVAQTATGPDRTPLIAVTEGTLQARRPATHPYLHCLDTVLRDCWLGHSTAACSATSGPLGGPCHHHYSARTAGDHHDRDCHSLVVFGPCFAF